MGFFSKLNGKPAVVSKTTSSQHETAANDYRGVEVISSQSECCEAAKAIAGQRFLSDELPMLPLRDCDVAECQCTYKRFEDRRSDIRRASDLSYDMASQLRDDDQRVSTSRGRRSDD